MKLSGIFIVFLFMCFISCDKEDVLPPSLVVNTPLALSNFNVLEYISVQGTASDETSIEYVELKLLNNNLASVSNQIVLYSNELNFNFNANLLIDDIHLSSGNYFLKVAVSDGRNVTTSYVEIFLSAVPLVLKKTYVVSSNTNSFNLYEIDGTTVALVESFQGNYESSVSNSYNQYLFFGSDQAGYGYDPDFNYIPWNIASDFSPYQYFNNSVYSAEDHLHYVSHGNGNVKGYDDNGNVIYSCSMNVNEYPEKLLIEQQKIFVEVFYTNFNTDLVVYFKGSGAESHRLAINKDIVSLIPKTEDQLYLLVNDVNESELFIYTSSVNGLWSPHSMPQGIVYDAVSISENELIIAHQTGLLRYTYDNNSLVAIVPNIQFKNVKYDQLNGVVVASVGSELRYYSNLGVAIGLVNTPEPIENFHFYYNK
ncbi:MAG: hypothetical protein P8M12_04115 [Flavobacteriales bacterium]|nr:hypothetical protein [Flavobacteriales bacterium]